MKESNAKTFYDTVMPDKFGGEYEFRRWFATPVLKAGYDMTKAMIERRILSLNKGRLWKHVLELGPGAGTWTKLLIVAHPEARYDLVDVSAEMLKLSQKALADHRQVDFFESDFMAFSPEEPYDFFFSSRAIEYIPNKETLVTKIASVLKPGGRGCIITKTPKYVRSALLGRRITTLHKGQISPRRFARLLVQQGLIDVAVFPATMYVPLLHSVRLNLLIWSVCSRFPLSRLTQLFSESYCITFRKP